MKEFKDVVLDSCLKSLEEMDTTFEEKTTQEDDDLEPGEVMFGNVKILNIACVGRHNGRIYFRCQCNRCLRDNVLVLEEEIRDFDPDKYCPDCGKNYFKGGYYRNR